MGNQLKNPFDSPAAATSHLNEAYLTALHSVLSLTTNGDINIEGPTNSGFFWLKNAENSDWDLRSLVKKCI